MDIISYQFVKKPKIKENRLLEVGTHLKLLKILRKLIMTA